MRVGDEISQEDLSNMNKIGYQDKKQMRREARKESKPTKEKKIIVNTTVE